MTIIRTLQQLRRKKENNQGPYRAAIAIRATEPEPLQKSELFLKNLIFTA
jgi:hypothetical protein